VHKIDLQDQQMNCVFTNYFITQLPPTYFGHECGHLQSGKSGMIPTYYKYMCMLAFTTLKIAA